MNKKITKDLRIVFTDGVSIVNAVQAYFDTSVHPLLRVEREKYEKSYVYPETSVFSYYDDKYFYLEQDHDGPRYLQSINLNWLDIPELFIEIYYKKNLTLTPFSTYTTKWDSELDKLAGI
tara:strand:- start:484 stop:843 length:360 start_codon:yes stop_codon:yes gene_type:complete